MDIIQFSDIKRCAQCGKIVSAGEDVHAECQRGYEQHWDGREAEMQYRASIGNDPRVRVTCVSSKPFDPFSSEDWAPPTDEELAEEDRRVQELEAELGLNMGPRLTIIK